MNAFADGRFNRDPKTTAIMAFTPQFHVMSLNQAARLILGCDPLPGEVYPLERLFDARDLPPARDAVNKALDSGHSSANQQGSITHVTGRRILCEYSAHPLFKKAHHIIGVILNFQPLDETGTQAAEGGACNPSEMPTGGDFHLRVFNDLPEGVFSIDIDWQITSFNHAAEQITGFNKAEVLGRKCWEIFQSDQCRNACPMAAALRTGRTYFDQEVVTLDRHGRRRTMMVNVNALKDKYGRLLGAVETFRGGDVLSPLSKGQDGFGGMVGRSRVMRDIFAMLPDIARSEASVLISGETGTGKDMLARVIHRLSNRKGGPFVAVNCSALAETLLESELFGHEKGAFTGADRSRPGRFEIAQDGTLLLDEIGELKLDLQVKLLRVLEQREFERVGGTRAIALHARILSATNRKLEKLLAEGRFREDLYYRLRTVPITIPPLRERPEDITPLVEHFIEKFNAGYGKKVRSVDPKVMRLFERYPWPGNVRELERCIEHAFVFVKGPVIFRHYLPQTDAFDPSPASPAAPGPIGDSHDRHTIAWALSQTGGKRKDAAALLGISRTSMWRRMKELGIS